MPSVGFVFRIQKFRRRQKGPPQYIFAIDKGFRRIFAMPLSCFVQQNFCSMFKRNWNFCKISDKSSSNCYCGHAKRNSDILARNFNKEAETVLFSVQTCWREKPFLLGKFFWNGSSRQVESSFVKPTETNWANGQVFLAQFPNLTTTSSRSMKNSSLKLPFGTNR